MPAKTRKEKQAQKEGEIKAKVEADAKKPKPKPRPDGATLIEPLAMPYMSAAVGHVVGITREEPYRLVTYYETEDELKGLLEAYKEELKVKKERNNA
jgi:hypothetical protein